MLLAQTRQGAGYTPTEDAAAQSDWAPAHQPTGSGLGHRSFKQTTRQAIEILNRCTQGGAAISEAAAKYGGTSRTGGLNSMGALATLTGLGMAAAVEDGTALGIHLAITVMTDAGRFSHDRRGSEGLFIKALANAALDIVLEHVRTAGGLHGVGWMDVVREYAIKAQYEASLVREEAPDVAGLQTELAKLKAEIARLKEESKRKTQLPSKRAYGGGFGSPAKGAGTCRMWNAGECARDGCRYSHKCTFCQGDHKGSRCSELGKRPKAD